MGDDLALDMSGMKISFHGQELKAVKEINIPSDVEVPDELPPGHINAFPDEAHGTLKVKPKLIMNPRGIRWRALKKAYRMMGVSKIEALLRILRLFVVDDTEKSGRVIVRMGSNTGKSAAPLEIVGYSDGVSFVGSPCDNEDCLAHDGLTGQCEIKYNGHLAAEREV